MVSDGYGTSKDMSDMPKPGEHGNRKSATIVITTAAGTYYQAECPYCKNIDHVGSMLSAMWKLCGKCGGSFDLRYSETSEEQDEEQDEEHDKQQGDDKLNDQPTISDGSSGPFNPPPAKPRIPDYPRGDSRRGPRNWPLHYGGRR